jgi:hypothetical protein
MALYSIPSERAVCERLNYDLLFKWFLDMRIDQPAFDPTTFTKNPAPVGARGGRRVLGGGGPSGQAPPLRLQRHLSVDGTLLAASASHKTFGPKDGPPPSDPPAGRNAEVGWHGQKRSNDTHASTTDPDARLDRKSNHTAAVLCYSRHG